MQSVERPPFTGRSWPHVTACTTALSPELRRRTQAGCIPGEILPSHQPSRPAFPGHAFPAAPKPGEIVSIARPRMPGPKPENFRVMWNRRGWEVSRQCLSPPQQTSDYQHCCVERGHRSVVLLLLTGYIHCAVGNGQAWVSTEH